MTEYEFNNFKLPQSPLKDTCNQRLSQFQPVQEKRKGRLLLCWLYFPASIIISLLIIFSMIDTTLPDFLVAYIIFPSSLLLIFVGAAFSAYELKLYAYNQSDQIFKNIQSLLNPNERYLAYTYGKILDIPDWFDNYSHLAGFIFTTERLIYIPFSPLISGINELDKRINKTQFPEALATIYTCELGDDKKVKLGGFIMPPLLHLSYTKLTVTPIGQNTPISYAINIKNTNTGKLINKLFEILKS